MFEDLGKKIDGLVDDTKLFFTEAIWNKDAWYYALTGHDPEAEEATLENECQISVEKYNLITPDLAKLNSSKTPPLDGSGNATVLILDSKAEAIKTIMGLVYDTTRNAQDGISHNIQLLKSLTANQKVNVNQELNQCIEYLDYLTGRSKDIKENFEKVIQAAKDYSEASGLETFGSSLLMMGTKALEGVGKFEESVVDYAATKFGEHAAKTGKDVFGKSADEWKDFVGYDLMKESDNLKSIYSGLESMGSISRDCFTSQAAEVIGEFATFDVAVGAASKAVSALGKSIKGGKAFQKATTALEKTATSTTKLGKTIQTAQKAGRILKPVISATAVPTVTTYVTSYGRTAEGAIAENADISYEELTSKAKSQAIKEAGITFAMIGIPETVKSIKQNNLLNGKTIQKQQEKIQKYTDKYNEAKAGSKKQEHYKEKIAKANDKLDTITVKSKELQASVAEAKAAETKMAADKAEMKASKAESKAPDSNRTIKKRQFADEQALRADTAELKSKEAKVEATTSKAELGNKKLKQANDRLKQANDNLNNATADHKQLRHELNQATDQLNNAKSPTAKQAAQAKLKDAEIKFNNSEKVLEKASKEQVLASESQKIVEAETAMSTRAALEAKMDLANYNVEKAKIEVKDAKAEVVDANTKLNQAKKDFIDRQNELNNASTATEKVEAKAKLDEAEKNLQQANKELTDANTNLIDKQKTLKKEQKVLDDSTTITESDVKRKENYAQKMEDIHSREKDLENLKKDTQTSKTEYEKKVQEQKAGNATQQDVDDALQKYEANEKAQKQAETDLQKLKKDNKISPTDDVEQLATDARKVADESKEAKQLLDKTRTQEEIDFLESRSAYEEAEKLRDKAIEEKTELTNKATKLENQQKELEVVDNEYHTAMKEQSDAYDDFLTKDKDYRIADAEREQVLQKIENDKGKAVRDALESDVEANISGNDIETYRTELKNANAKVETAQNELKSAKDKLNQASDNVTSKIEKQSLVQEKYDPNFEKTFDEVKADITQQAVDTRKLANDKNLDIQAKGKDVTAKYNDYIDAQNKYRTSIENKVPSPAENIISSHEPTISEKIKTAMPDVIDQAPTKIAEIEAVHRQHDSERRLSDMLVNNNSSENINTSRPINNNENETIPSPIVDSSEKDTIPNPSDDGNTQTDNPDKERRSIQPTIYNGDDDTNMLEDTNPEQYDPTVEEVDETPEDTYTPTEEATETPEDTYTAAEETTETPENTYTAAEEETTETPENTYTAAEEETTETPENTYTPTEEIAETVSTISNQPTTTTATQTGYTPSGGGYTSGGYYNGNNYYDEPNSEYYGETPSTEDVPATLTDDFRTDDVEVSQLIDGNTTSLDDIITPDDDHYTVIPTPTAGSVTRKTTGGSKIIPIAAGLSAAAAAGIGAKAYLDHKKNNENSDDEEYDEYEEYETEDPSNGDINADEWNEGNSESLEIQYDSPSNTQEEYLDDDEYTETEKYGARNNQELADIQ